MIYNNIISKYLLNPDINIYNSNNYISLDFETTNFDKGDPTNLDNHLVLACWYLGRNGKHYYSWNNEFRMGKLIEHLLSCDFIIAHNAKFELGWLKRCGVDLTQVLCFCTQIAEYTLHQGMTVDLSLDGTLKRRQMPQKQRLGNLLIHNGVETESVPKRILLEYCSADVKVTTDLALVQLRELRELELLPVVYTRNLFTAFIACTEFNSMELNKERVYEDYVKTTKELNEVEQRINEFTGGLNPGSSKQMAEYLFDTLGFAEPRDWKGNPVRTASGKRSTDAKVIAKLLPRNKRQREFLGLKKSHAKLQSRISKYLEKFKLCCDESNGLIRFNFNQTITQTGRLSSNGKRYKVQGQNIQRDLKRLFWTHEVGTIIQERDHAQLEFRVAGELTGCPQVYQDVIEHFDVHAYTASIIFPGSTDPKQARINAKAHTFKPLYGGESGTDLERSYYDAFKQKYKRMKEVQDLWVDLALKSKKLVSPITKLIFHFPDMKITKSGYIQGNTKVRDYPIQYFATGEILPIGCLIFWHLLRAMKLKSYIMLTIHDSVINKLYEEEKELVDEIAVQSLTKLCVDYIEKLYGYRLKYPLEIELKESQFWGKD